MMLTLQVVASALLVVAVFWYMWRLPLTGDRYFGWAPPLALLSAWLGLAAVVVSGLLWVLPYPDRWVAATFLVLDPGAIGTGMLVLWIYRGQSGGEPTIAIQSVQAKVGITLGVIAVVIGYVFVMTQKTPGSVIGA